MVVISWLFLPYLSIMHHEEPTFFFFLNDPPPTKFSPLPLHDPLPISPGKAVARWQQSGFIWKPSRLIGSHCFYSKKLASPCPSARQQPYLARARRSSPRFRRSQARA